MAFINQKMSQINEEASQTLARVVISCLVILFFVINNFISSGNFHQAMSLETKIVFAYAMISIPWFFWVKKTPNQHTWRRYITLFADLELLSLALHLSGPKGSFFYPIYLWVIIGNGLRFGIRPLLVAILTGAVSFFMLLKFNHFWQANIDIGYGLLAGVIILPTFFIKVINRTHKLNQRLEVELEKSHTAEKAKGDFLANMSHEIRTPMNGVLGMVQILGDSDLNIEQRDHLNIIQRSADSLLNILNDILDFSKITSGKLEIESVPINLRNTLEDVVHLLNSTAEEKSIALNFDYPDNQHEVFLGDPTRIRQIILNLMGNAIKFTEQGSVTLICRYNQETTPNIRLEIKDTGIGIPADRIHSIFEEFEQAEQGTTRKFGGTGLGLAISLRLAKMMQGLVKVKSELGKGSNFIVKLNLEPSFEPLITRKINHEFPNFGLKALVAEDNTVNQLVVKKLLKKIGVSMQLAKNGQEAVDMLMENTFDLIFMDVRMPIMNGKEATKAIRASDSSQKNIPILALTADASTEDAKQCLSVGMNAHLRKPLKLDELIAELENIFVPQRM